MAQTASSRASPGTPLTPEDLEGDLIQPGHPLFGIIWVNPERLSGAPCFAGTRVPIKVLFDYLGSRRGTLLLHRRGDRRRHRAAG